MLKKLMKIANEFPMEDRSLLSNNNYAATLIVTDDSYLIEENKDKKSKTNALVTIAKRTSGVTPLLGPDQIKYVFPGFSDKHNQAYMEQLELFCAWTENSKLLRLQKALKDITCMLETDNSELEPIQIEQKFLICSIGKRNPGGFVDIKIDQEPIIKEIIDLWKEYQKESIATDCKEQFCSVCGCYSLISPRIPKPLNEFFSSNNQCSEQYGNTNSSICIDCAFKTNSTLNNMATKYLMMGKGASATTYIVKHFSTLEDDDGEIMSIDSFSPYIKDLYKRRELYRQPENIELMLVSENNQGRSTYFGMDIIENIYQFFSAQKDFLKENATNFYSINDLSYFYIIGSNFTDKDIARKIFFRYAISKQLKKKAWLFSKTLKQVERCHKLNLGIDFNKLFTILNIMGVQMSENTSVITMGRVLANMARVQKQKRVKKSYIERYAHQLVRNPQLLGKVITEFRKSFGSEHSIRVENWEELIKGLPSRRLTNEETLVFHIALEQEKTRLISESKERKENEQEERG